MIIRVKCIKPIVRSDYDWHLANGVREPATDDEIEDQRHEQHELVFCNENVVLTTDEYCYALYHRDNGVLFLGNLWKPGEWKITSESLEELSTLKLQ